MNGLDMWRRHIRPTVVCLALACALVGCDGFKAELLADPKPETTTQGHLTLRVHVQNPPAGLRYRWRAQRGQCQPDLSPNLSTTYSPPDVPGEDRVTVEVLQGDKTIYEEDITITVLAAGTNAEVGAQTPAPQATPASSPTQPATSGATLRLTETPPYDPLGGPDSVADIAGEVLGVANPQTLKIVLFSWTDKAYVQPLIANPYTDIDQEGKFYAQIHTGSRYSILLVRPTYKPPSTTTRVPGVGGDVIAVLTVPGKR